MKLHRFAVALGVLALVAAAGAGAQSFPQRPIRMIVPFPPGTASDFLGRTSGQALGELYKQQVVVDNRPGAGGLIGSGLIVSAPPDGYTLGVIGPPTLASPLLQDKAPYRPVEDFTAIAELAAIPNVLVVAPELKVASVKDLVALLRAKPGAYNYASVGVGSLAHFAAELFNRAGGVKAVHVPFKLMADVNTEMLSSRVHYVVLTAPSAVPLLRDGRLRPLAVTSAKRASALPDVPTIAEAGLPEAESVAWFGIVGPAKMQAALVAKIHADVGKILKDPDIRERFARQGAEPNPGTTSQEFAKLIQSEYRRYQALVKETGMKAQ